MMIKQNGKAKDNFKQQNVNLKQVIYEIQYSNTIINYGFFSLHVIPGCRQRRMQQFLRYAMQSGYEVMIVMKDKEIFDKVKDGTLTFEEFYKWLNYERHSSYMYGKEAYKEIKCMSGARL